GLGRSAACASSEYCGGNSIWRLGQRQISRYQKHPERNLGAARQFGPVFSQDGSGRRSATVPFFSQRCRNEDGSMCPFILLLETSLPDGYPYLSHHTTAGIVARKN